jgi:ribonuclease BN (tRNA processing enzyme)
VRLTVLGCAGSFPSAESPCSSYLVEAGGFRLVVDMGNGSLSALQRYAGLYDVDAVLLTHLHPDHWIDLCQYLVARKYAKHCEVPLLPVYGPPGTAERVDAAYGEGCGAADGVFEYRTLREETFTVGPLELTTCRVNHPVETYGLRISHEGRSLTYSSDTAESDALVALARHTDAFLCEASFQDGHDNVPGLHLTGRGAGEHAARAGARRLLLTHLVPAWVDVAHTLAAARSAYCGPVEAVRSGSVYDL